MPHVDYFFATISPFAYLAGTRLEEIAAKHGATITYKPVDLMALFNQTGGTKPAERHASRQEYRFQELRRQAEETGLPMNMKPAHFPTNMAPSSYAIIAAQEEKANGADGDLGKLVHCIMAACWAEEKNIAEDDVIRACLSDAGFDPDLANRGLLSGAETYAANLEEASERGVFGSPFYIADGDERFWGQDRLDALDRHLAKG